MNLHRSVLAFVVSLLLMACGGGGGSSSGPPSPPPPGVSFGLNERPSNTSCVAPARTTGSGIGLELPFPSLPLLDSPLKLIQPPGDDSVWFAVSRAGGLDRFQHAANASSFVRYLEIPVTTTGEAGLLGAVFHPEWPSRKEIFVSYLLNDGGLQSRVSRLVITDDATLPATYTEEILLTVDQPTAFHNGGDLAFGNDGFLYFGLGDGGGAGDPGNHAQNRTSLLGKLLRIDVVDVPFPSPGYRIPATNPHAGNPRCGAGANSQDCPEIYAIGFRNPWRFSVDAPTGQIWLADVGQSAREEVNLVTRNGNYGWRCREGTLPFNESGCPTSGFIDPVHEYGHSNANASITGGFVYRSSRIAALQGRYVFGDWASGRIWALREVGSGFAADELAVLNLNLPAFSQGHDGEVYALSGNGFIYRFTGAGAAQDPVPDLLTESGCVSATDPRQPAGGLVAYAPVAEFWSDRAVKTRWIGLPNGATISVRSDDDWTFPPGSVLVKNFQLDGTLIETRLLMRHPDGDWAGYTYQWNAGQTQATRVRNGATRPVGNQTWIYPSEAECMACHTEAAGFVLGAETAQLNSNFTYTRTGRTDNQLRVFNHIGMFSVPVPEPVSLNPALVSPANASAGLNDRARAYLHTNCAQCHQPDGPGRVDLDLRYATPLAATGACDTLPQVGDLGIADARIIALGSADRSTLHARINRRDADAMPPLSSNVIDSDGAALIAQWINSLNTCQ